MKKMPKNVKTVEKKCPRCEKVIKNKYFNPHKPKNIPDWCKYCALEFIFMETYEARKTKKKKRKYEY